MTSHTPSRGRYVAGCHCTGCTAENRAYNRRWARLSGYDGVASTDLVDAGPVREHVRRLLAAGMGTRQISASAGVQRKTVTNLLNGRPDRGNPPTARVRPENARALLAVEPVPADGALVDASGTRRRLRALVACGWSMGRLADKLGMTVANLAPTISGTDTDTRVTYRFAVRVSGLHEELWDTAPPQDDRREKAAVSRALKLAADRGWVPPAGWDDEWIDLPETDLAELLARQASAMESAQAWRCYQARKAGDRSPLVLAGAAEYMRRTTEAKRAKAEAA